MASKLQPIKKLLLLTLFLFVFSLPGYKKYKENLTPDFKDNDTESTGEEIVKSNVEEFRSDAELIDEFDQEQEDFFNNYYYYYYYLLGGENWEKIDE